MTIIYNQVVQYISIYQEMFHESIKYLLGTFMKNIIITPNYYPYCYICPLFVSMICYPLKMIMIWIKIHVDCVGMYQVAGIF